MLKADFHIHSNEDKRDLIAYSAREFIDAAAEKKFDVLALTNHDIFTYSQELSDYAAEKGILLIPGIESTIEGKHVVILNPPERRRSRPDFRGSEGIQGKTSGDFRDRSASILSASQKIFPAFQTAEKH